MTVYGVRVGRKAPVYRPEPLIEALHEAIRKEWRRYRWQRGKVIELRNHDAGGAEHLRWFGSYLQTKLTLALLFRIRRAGRQR